MTDAKKLELQARVDFERSLMEHARQKYRNARARYRLAKRQLASAHGATHDQ